MFKMKHSNFIILLVLLLSSCFPDDMLPPDAFKGYGELSLSTIQQEKEIIKLTNARSEEVKANNQFLTIFSENDTLINRAAFTAGESHQLAVGEYTCVVEEIDQLGRVQRKGEAPVTILKDQTSKVEVPLKNQFFLLIVNLTNLEGATVWVVQEGQEPADGDLMSFKSISKYYEAIIYPDYPIFEVIVEYEGERKRFSAEAVVNADIFVWITRKIENGTVEITTTYEPQEIIDHSFEW